MSANEMQRLEEVADTYHDLIQFTEWLTGHGRFVVGEWLEVDADGKPRIEPRLVPSSKSAQSLVYEYLGIDETALEQERRVVLSALRRGKGTP